MTCSIYIIAGEASGDFIGGEIMRALHAEQPATRFHGIGGEQMRAAGLASLFPIEDIALMGFAEVVPHIRRLRRRIRETVADIQRIRPDIVLTIDSPGFNFRVVQSLKHAAFKADTHPKLIHAVAPTVWAYKPERARKTADLYDHLLTLLPFEPPYFEREGLATTYIGHAKAWEWRTKGDAAAFRARRGIDETALTIGMMPGSRDNELTRHLPVFKDALRRLYAHYPRLELIVPIRPAMEFTLRAQTADWPMPIHLVVGDAEKKNAFAACEAALAKSGTISLETVLAGIPTITAYRAHPLSAWLVRRMIRIPYANLVNIIEGRKVVPELLQERCTPQAIADNLQALIENDTLRAGQLSAGMEVAAKLGAHEALSPAQKAVEIIMHYSPGGAA